MPKRVTEPGLRVRRLLVVAALAGCAGASGVLAASDTNAMREAARQTAETSQHHRTVQTGSQAEINEEMREIARAITEGTSRDIAKRIAEEYGKTHPNVRLPQPDAAPTRQAYIFVSRSLGAAALEEIFRSIAGTSTVAVFRGIPEGSRLGPAMTEIHTMLRALELDPVPTVTINPARWQTFGIEDVPTLLIAEGDTELARVSGMTNVGWLERQFERGEEGDQGVRGPIEVPSEPDLIEVMRERASQLDYADIREKTIKSYWDDVPMEDLPAATQNSQRLIDLRVRVTEDITTPDGRYIARKGDVINPLDIRPFTRRLVIFDPTRADELVFARDQAQSYDNTILMASRFDREQGWDGFNALEAQLGEPLYRLTEDVLSRFRVRATPSVVHATQKGDVAISEYHLEKRVSE